MSDDVWAVPGVTERVVDGMHVDLRLDLGWRLTLAARCRLAAVMVSGDDDEAARRALISVLHVNGGAMDGSGVEVRLTSYDLLADGTTLGTIALSTPQGGMIDLSSELLGSELAAPIARD
jgi:hypothetical protein